jgi:hypothetical protein
MTRVDRHESEVVRGSDVLVPVALIVVAATFFAIGIWAFVWGYERTPQSNSFVRTTGFQIWAVLIGTQTAYWAVTLVPLWRLLRGFRQQVREHWIQVALCYWLISLLLLAGPWIATETAAASVPWPLWGHEFKITSLTAVAGLLLGVPALCGMSLVPLRVETECNLVGLAGRVQVLVEGERLLHRLLVISGTLVGLAILAFGAARSAVVPTYVPEALLPEEQVLLYGAFLTALLLFVYAPARLAVRAAARDLIEDALPWRQIPALASDDFPKWTEKRKLLEEMLRASTSLRQELESGLFVLSPLLSALITLLVPAFEGT